jgi:hypothetical protein
VMNASNIRWGCGWAPWSLSEVLRSSRGSTHCPRPKTCRFRFAQPRRIADSCFKMHIEGESWWSYIPCGSASKLQGKHLAYHALSYWSSYCICSWLKTSTLT